MVAKRKKKALSLRGERVQYPVQQACDEIAELQQQLRQAIQALRNFRMTINEFESRQRCKTQEIGGAIQNPNKHFMQCTFANEEGIFILIRVQDTCSRKEERNASFERNYALIASATTVQEGSDAETQHEMLLLRLQWAPFCAMYLSRKERICILYYIWNY
ncbi:unnamed protein product [Haemonchus placei]|uniref:Uncharacterized protein n=1 Tax=Haemonchus placei TaxID=6290 RepID=A0A0N4WGK9_HAEPC|nr:unnamed protein product [Haemonchus placei]